MIRCLKTSNELHNHGWRSYKSLFSKLPRDNFSSQHIYVFRSKTFAILTSSKIRVWVSDNFQIIRLLISKHVTFCSLQITHYAFQCLSLLQSRITQVSTFSSIYPKVISSFKLSSDTLGDRIINKMPDVELPSMLNTY